MFIRKVAGQMRGEFSRSAVPLSILGLMLVIGTAPRAFAAPLFAAPFLSVDSGAYSVAIGDLNGDGRVDLVAVNYSAVSVHLGNGDGTLGPRTD
jgi:hypothetical protein